MEKTTVIIVEDEALFREMLRRSLDVEEGIKVLGTAEDGETAIQLATDVKPEVVLMDIELPGEIDGIEAALQIKKDKPGTGIVILSAHSDSRYVTSLPIEDSPGWAYLLKQTVPDMDALIRAIEGSKAGMVVLDPTVVTSLRPKHGTSTAKLTHRQQEVLELLAQGYSNKAIAKRLTLSEKSVETYINVIYQQLDLSKQPESHARVKATLRFLEDSQRRH